MDKRNAFGVDLTLNDKTTLNEDMISVCVCVCVSGHQSVYLARTMRWWGSNLRQWIFLNLGSMHPPSTFLSPPTPKMHARDETNEGQTLGTFMATSAGNQNAPIT